MIWRYRLRIHGFTGQRADIKFDQSPCIVTKLPAPLNLCAAKSKLERIDTLAEAMLEGGLRHCSSNWKKCGVVT
jgi:hypothetical protein